MKSISKFQFLKTIMAAFALVFTLASCGDDDAAGSILPSASSSEVVTVPFFVVNESGETPSSLDDVLFEARTNAPVNAPDGHQLTWAEFSSVNGTIDLMCTTEGVEATMKLTGLVPNGVYTFWNLSFDAPGIQPTMEGMNIRGLGAAGLGDGSDNYFIASPDGKGEITMLSPGGDLSLQGDMGACPLTENYEFHVVGAYHMDSQTYGPIIGPEGTFAEQFGFVFVNQ